MGSIYPDSDRLYVRLETRKRAKKRFWEVIVAGRALHTRHGLIGRDGQVGKPRQYASPQAAKREAERRIAEKERGDYARVEAEVEAEPYQPDLARAILDAPDDHDGYLVYADWLQSQGIPRGELIALFHAMKRKPRSAPLHRARRRFRKLHGPMLPTRIVEAMEQRTWSDPICALEWQLGYIHKAQIHKLRSRLPHTVRELVATLLAHPSALFLRELGIGSLGDGASSDYGPVIAAICHAAPQALRNLDIASLHTDRSPLAPVLLGDVTRLLSDLPRLESLTLSGDEIALSPASAPALRAFTLHNPSLDRELLGAVDSSMASRDGGPGAWPHLASLSIYGNGNRFDIDALPALLSGQGVPELRALRIPSTTTTIAVWNALARSPVAAQLTALDLSYGDLSDADASQIAAHIGSFARLDRLNVDGNYLSRAARHQLRELLPNISIADQRGSAADMPTITNNEIVDLAPDSTSALAFRDIGHSANWLRFAVWGSVVWGRYRGTVGEYDVCADIRAVKAGRPRAAGCTCPSRKYPCKHALGLMLLVAEARVLSVTKPPPGLIERCRG